MTKSRMLKAAFFFLTICLDAASAHGQEASDRLVTSYGATVEMGVAGSDTIGGGGGGGGLSAHGRLDLVDDALVLRLNMDQFGVRGFAQDGGSSGGIIIDGNAIVGARMTSGDCNLLGAVMANVDNGGRIGGGATRAGEFDLSFGPGVLCFNGSRYYLGTLGVGPGLVMTGEGASSDDAVVITTDHVIEINQDLLASIHAMVAFMGGDTGGAERVALGASGALFSLIQRFNDSPWGLYWGASLGFFAGTDAEGDAHGGMDLTMLLNLRETVARRGSVDGGSESEGDNGTPTVDSAMDDGGTTDDLSGGEMAASREAADSVFPE